MPPPWTAHDVGDCIEITLPEGAGALHISAARKQAAVADPDLHEFAEEELPSGSSLEPASAGDFVGVSAEYVDWSDTRFWKKWWLRTGPLMLYITYTCTRGDEHIEEDDVERILSSLAVRQI
jgi:hypothetical protein